MVFKQDDLEATLSSVTSQVSNTQSAGEETEGKITSYVQLCLLFSGKSPMLEPRNSYGKSDLASVTDSPLLLWDPFPRPVVHWLLYSLRTWSKYVGSILPHVHRWKPKINCKISEYAKRNKISLQEAPPTKFVVSYLAILTLNGRPYTMYLSDCRNSLKSFLR